MSIADEMRKRLEAAFAPELLQIEDESESHRGHAGYQEGGESHWRITLKSAAFAEMSRLERHRAVHAALGDDIVRRIHALALSLSG
ncbi:MAG: BolA family protein [Boseongicola sp.]